MKTLTIKQPWASLIAHGIKDIENRTWKTNYRGRILIHAGATHDKEFKSWISDALGGKVKSAIIGEVDIIGCVLNHESPWAEQTASMYDQGSIKNRVIIWNWILANPVLYKEPILNVKGCQKESIRHSSIRER